jgi:hypothetical protein
MPTISKSSFVRAMQCHKSLYMHFFQPEHRDQVSESQQHIFDIGHNTGHLAQQLFPGGVDASRGNPQDVRSALDYTRQLIADNHEVIYEAAFSDGHTRCYMDILAKIEGQWHAFEVKASTSLKAYHLQDVAFQFYAIRQAGLNLRSISLVHLNNQYVRRGNIDVNQLFTKIDLTQKAIEMQPEVVNNLEAIQNMFAADTMPAITIGPQCNDPFTCDFYQYCHKDEQPDQYTGIKGIRAHKIETLRNNQVKTIAGIPQKLAFTSKEMIVLRGLLNNEIHVNKAKLMQFMAGLEYPLYFLDFETIMPAVPLYDESRPYQQLTFQYSLHIRQSPGEAVTHYEYLGSPPDDPRPQFITSLLAQTGNRGSIVVYNKAFEQTRIRELARDFPEHSNSLLALNGRMQDLMVPFRSQFLYRPEMAGSFSIKMVLPALVPDLSYSVLEIQEGGTASLVYLSLYQEQDPQKIDSNRNNLRKYCALDTLAMVRLLDAITAEIS